jgi:uncharacterized protein YndB with AHSA1/START domain
MINNELTVSESIEVDASAAKAWQVLTTPEIIKEYLFGTETITNWKPGNEIIFQGEYEGKTYKDKGIIIKNELNRLIEYSYWSGFSGLEDLPENYSTVTYNLEPISDHKTRFTWTQKGFRNEEGQAHSQNGMKGFLEQIKGIMER